MHEYLMIEELHGGWWLRRMHALEDGRVWAIDYLERFPTATAACAYLETMP